MRFEEEFEYEINTSKITSDMLIIPSMLIQPYVENSVKHGLLHKKGLKSLRILFSQDSEYLTVQVIDNGIGIEASTKINEIRSKKHQSFANDANKKRIEILNSNLKDTIGIEIITLKNEHQQTSGTKVIIKIPIFS
jgi:LytS/YehU family sensor histidine kinase